MCLGVFLSFFFDLTASPDVECFFPAVLSSKFQLNLSVKQTLSFSKKRGASGALLSFDQSERATRNIECPPGMEDYFTKKVMTCWWKSELVVYLLCPTDVVGVVHVLAKNACDRE